MTGRKFFGFLGFVFLVALVIYLVSTPHGADLPLVGVIDGNEVIVSSQITGRMVRLLVDEGSEVKQGQLLAELDPAELQALLASQVANISSLESRIAEEGHTYGLTDAQTAASMSQADAGITSMQAQLEEARANLQRDELNTQRTVKLAEGGVASAQDRDTAVANLKASQAHVKSLEEQVKAQRAGLSVVQASRKQLEVEHSEAASLEAQLAQARALKAQAEVQLGYAKIVSPLDGIVSVRVAKQGEVVAPGAPIVVIVDVDHLWVRADVEESYVDSIHFGDKVKVRLPSGNVLEGSVFFKGVESDFATQRDVSRTKRDIKTFAIKVAVPNPDHDLFTGMTATVLLPPPPGKKSWWASLGRQKP
jgi:HlyD family secretion protein